MIVQISLKLGSLNLAQTLLNSDFFTSSMTGNVHFAGAEVVAQVVVVKGASTTLRTTFNLPLYPTKTSDLAKYLDLLRRELTKIKSMVQYVANAQSVLDLDRVAIVESAGMTVKGYTNPLTRVFNAVCSAPNTLSFTAKGGVNGHEWQYTYDVINFTGRIALETSTVAHIDVSALAKGDVACFHKALIAGETTYWDGPVIVTVV